MKMWKDFWIKFYNMLTGFVVPYFHPHFVPGTLPQLFHNKLMKLSSADYCATEFDLMTEVFQTVW